MLLQEMMDMEGHIHIQRDFFSLRKVSHSSSSPTTQPSAAHLDPVNLSRHSG